MSSPVMEATTNHVSSVAQNCHFLSLWEDKCHTGSRRGITPPCCGQGMCSPARASTGNKMPTPLIISCLSAHLSHSPGPGLSPVKDTACGEVLFLNPSMQCINSQTSRPRNIWSTVRTIVLAILHLSYGV